MNTPHPVAHHHGHRNLILDGDESERDGRFMPEADIVIPFGMDAFKLVLPTYATSGFEYDIASAEATGIIEVLEKNYIQRPVEPGQPILFGASSPVELLIKARWRGFVTLKEIRAFSPEAASGHSFLIEVY